MSEPKHKHMLVLLTRLKEWTLVPFVNLGTIAGVTFLHVEEFLKLVLMIVTLGWTLWQWHRLVARDKASKSQVPEDCPFRDSPEVCPLFKEAMGLLRDKMK